MRSAGAYSIFSVYDPAEPLIDDEQEIDD